MAHSNGMVFRLNSYCTISQQIFVYLTNIKFEAHTGTHLHPPSAPILLPGMSKTKHDVCAHIDTYILLYLTQNLKKKTITFTVDIVGETSFLAPVNIWRRNTALKVLRLHRNN
jgi:hypothetical protein